MVEKKQCQEQVYDARLSYQCTKKAIVERDGKSYCKVHDPEYIKEKQRQWVEKFDKKQLEIKKTWQRAEVIEKVCEPFTTEWLEANITMLKASKDLYDACQATAKYLRYRPAKTLELCDLLEQNVKATRKAEGK